LKRTLVLGSTGSIGIQTIDIISRHPDNFVLAGLHADRNREKLLEFSKSYPAIPCCLGSKTDNAFKHSGPGSLKNFIENTKADIVLNAIAGSAGLLPSVWALNSGKDLALANKETIVMAGRLIMDIARQNGKKLLPVDSEHSALFNLIERFGKNNIQELIITASGGAFRNDPVSSLKDKTPLEALKHPTWNMGPKITIDSASMANKGLEVIEAARLFEMNAAEIKVLIHPESRVHSLVRSMDGSLYAQISKPDMRLAILNALSWPLVLKESLANLDLTDSSLNFFKPEPERYPLLGLAYEALALGEGFCCAYNAANEVAVEAFIKGKIRFVDISRIVELTLGTRFPENIDSIEEAMESDKLARALAVKEI